MQHISAGMSTDLTTLYGGSQQGSIHKRYSIHTLINPKSHLTKDSIRLFKNESTYDYNRTKWNNNWDMQTFKHIEIVDLHVWRMVSLANRVILGNLLEKHSNSDTQNANVNIPRLPNLLHILQNNTIRCTQPLAPWSTFTLSNIMATQECPSSNNRKPVYPKPL